MKHVRVALLAATLLGVAIPVDATPIFSTATLNNTLTIDFTAPVQHLDHNVIQFALSSLSPSGSLETFATLYEGATLLGSGTGTLGPFFARFAAPTSSFASSANALINFAAIADGVALGQVVLTLQGTGSVSWDTDDIRLRTFGDSGGYVSFYPEMTNFSVSTVNAASPVPEPATLTMLGLGLAGLASRYRRRK